MIPPNAPTAALLIYSLLLAAKTIVGIEKYKPINKPFIYQSLKRTKQAQKFDYLLAHFPQESFNPTAKLNTGFSAR